jgi:hypothetical protein
MNNETIFQVVNAIALLSWIVLLIFPFNKEVWRILAGAPVALLAICYVWLIAGSLQPADFEKFRTLEGITSLLSVPGAALAGWIHYLAFDLMTGLFIAQNAAKHGVSHGLLVPALLFTFMLGPAGLLLYFIIRYAITRQWFADTV